MAPPPRPIPPYTIQIYTPSQLGQQPALADELTELVNESFLAQVKHSLGEPSLRLTRPGQLIEEIGPSGLTAVCFQHAIDGDEKSTRAIGTATIKAWTGDVLWNRPRTCTDNADSETRSQDTDELVPVDGDFEVAIVAVKPGAKFRGQGIPDRLVGACEQAVLSKWVVGEEDISLQAQAQAGSSVPRNQAGISTLSPIRIMVKVAREITELYWAKKGFVTVGERQYSPGTWGFKKEFTISAMVRELPVGHQEGRSGGARVNSL